jgi:NodT family efflux transporter outer membrane factor (OMF) lipoprotein
MRIVVLLAVATIIAGCMHSAALTLPEDAPAKFEYSESVAQDAIPTAQWYRGFGSDELDSLVDFAVHNNGDLAAARARAQQADAHARAAGAALLPSLEAAGNANYLAGHSANGGGHELDWSAMLSASYEIDFWGKNQATAKSAQLLAGAARAERDAVNLTILAGVASGYFQVLALRERLGFARSNAEAAQKLLEVVRSRFTAGMASPLEVAAQTAAFDATQIATTDLQQRELEARTALALLLGRPPENLQIHADRLESLSEPVVAAGLPSQLLMRRPDIFMAEANLQSAHADLHAARAAMLPNVSLTAGAGVQNPALPATVLTIPGVGPSFAAGAGLLQPIFDHGRLRAQRDEAQAREEELMAAYRLAIIQSFVDVENALGAIHHLDAARSAQLESVAQSARALEGAELRYRAGSLDFLTLLESQRLLFSVRDQFVQYELARLQALVSLCKALGGGWLSPKRDSNGSNS